MMMGNSSYLLVNDLRVHYLHWNQADGSPLLVCLHGLASNARIWQLVAPHLVERGFSLIAPDARGHGLTDKPDDDYSFEAVLRDLAGLIKTCEITRPILVGHSWGAAIALDYAARFPGGPLAPAAIILVDGGFNQMDQQGLAWEQMRDLLTPPRLAGMPLEAFLSRLNSFNSRWQPDSEAAQIILANMEVTENETIYPRLTFERHMQIVRAMWEFQTYERFAAVRCPVLMIPARPAEPLSPQEREHLASKERGIALAQERIRNLRVHWMTDSIHDVPLQRPAELAEVIAEFVLPTN
jgi:pimeloyl-ACP methyl ester carboxylesterase